MATKKKPVIEEKKYLIVDLDGDIYDYGTLSEITKIIEDMVEEGDDLRDYTICEIGQGKKITFVPSTIKIG